MLPNKQLLNFDLGSLEFPECEECLLFTGGPLNHIWVYTDKERGGLWSLGSPTVRHDWATSLSLSGRHNIDKDDPWVGIFQVTFICRNWQSSVDSDR